MAKRQQRLRAARAVGSQRPLPRTVVGADTSCSDNDASSSESSAAEDPRAELVAYSWYREYEELTERYRWQVAAYIAWAASPARGRLPETQAELATLLGYRTDRTIRKWREEMPEIEAEIKARQAGPLWRHRRDLFDALVDVAVGGDVPALRLALEMTGDYVPKRAPLEVKPTAAPYTADELAQAEAELLAWETAVDEA